MSGREAARSGQNAPMKPSSQRKRTKTGCLTCRKRRIKCGEERPMCHNCVTNKRLCEGYHSRVVSKPSFVQNPKFPVFPARKPSELISDLLQEAKNQFNAAMAVCADSNLADQHAIPIRRLRDRLMLWGDGAVLSRMDHSSEPSREFLCIVASLLRSIYHRVYAMQSRIMSRFNESKTIQMLRQHNILPIGVILHTYATFPYKPEYELSPYEHSEMSIVEIIDELETDLECLQDLTLMWNDDDDMDVPSPISLLDQPFPVWMFDAAQKSLDPTIAAPFGVNMIDLHPLPTPHVASIPMYDLDDAAVENHDDDYWDVESESGAPTIDTFGPSTPRTAIDDIYPSIAYGSEDLDHYRPAWAASPLRHAPTAAIFAFFVRKVAPSLVISPGPNWLLEFAPLALHSQMVVHAMLAISSSYIALQQGESLTPSLKHLLYAVKALNGALHVSGAKHSCGHTDVMCSMDEYLHTLVTMALLTMYESLNQNLSKMKMHIGGFISFIEWREPAYNDRVSWKSNISQIRAIYRMFGYVAYEATLLSILAAKPLENHDVLATAITRLFIDTRSGYPATRLDWQHYTLLQKVDMFTRTYPASSENTETPHISEIDHYLTSTDRLERIRQTTDVIEKPKIRRSVCDIVFDARDNMAEILLERCHPNVPQNMALAASATAARTATAVQNTIRIGEALLELPISEYGLGTVAAGTREILMPLFVAGIGLTSQSDRDRMLDVLQKIETQFAWKQATNIARACETSWVKLAEIGRGPPHNRRWDVTSKAFDPNEHFEYLVHYVLS